MKALFITSKIYLLISVLVLVGCNSDSDSITPTTVENIDLTEENSTGKDNDDEEPIIALTGIRGIPCELVDKFDKNSTKTYSGTCEKSDIDSEIRFTSASGSSPMITAYINIVDTSSRINIGTFQYSIDGKNQRQEDQEDHDHHNHDDNGHFHPPPYDFVIRENNVWKAGVTTQRNPDPEALIQINTLGDQPNENLPNTEPCVLRMLALNGFNILRSRYTISGRCQATYKADSSSLNGITFTSLQNNPTIKASANMMISNTVIYEVGENKVGESIFPGIKPVGLDPDSWQPKKVFAVTYPNKSFSFNVTLTGD